ncbi:MAG: cyclic nucleotide-binding domain-containing protein [Deltaproteobacteria bacterium]|nr:cyclic nucleotide-binding domain-containing protein [Deltaproteobacteria bacterium]
MEISEIEYTLENCELFKGLGKENIEEISRLCRIESFGAGEYVFHQGDFGEYIYIVAEGQLFLQRSIDLGSRKGNAVIGVLGRGRAFGCWSGILGRPHHLMSSAICKKDLKVVALNGTDLRGLLLDDVKLGFRVLENLCFLLRTRIQGVLGAMERV